MFCIIMLAVRSFSIIKALFGTSSIYSRLLFTKLFRALSKEIENKREKKIGMHRNENYWPKLNKRKHWGRRQIIYRLYIYNRLVVQQIVVQRCNRLYICSVVDVHCMVSSDSR